MTARQEKVRYALRLLGLDSRSAAAALAEVEEWEQARPAYEREARKAVRLANARAKAAEAALETAEAFLQGTDDAAKQLAVRVDAAEAERDKLTAIANYLWDHYLLPIDDEHRERIRAALGEQA